MTPQNTKQSSDLNPFTNSNDQYGLQCLSHPWADLSTESHYRPQQLTQLQPSLGRYPL